MQTTLRAHVLERSGVPLGGSGSLGAMLQRSFGAPTFAAFWRHWNPIWGYYLSRGVYLPARRVLPRAAAVLLTFVVSGALHDLAIWLFRGETNGLLTLAFGLMGAWVVGGSWLRVDLSGLPTWLRAAVHISSIATSLATAKVLLTIL